MICMLSLIKDCVVFRDVTSSFVFGIQMTLTVEDWPRSLPHSCLIIVISRATYTHVTIEGSREPRDHRRNYASVRETNDPSSSVSSFLLALAPRPSLCSACVRQLSFSFGK